MIAPSGRNFAANLKPVIEVRTIRPLAMTQEAQSLVELLPALVFFEPKKQPALRDADVNKHKY